MWKGVRALIFAGPAAGVFRGMATLALGSGAARLIGIASIPILTRIYSPEDFGALAVFTALVALLAPILTWRYVLAIPLPRHDGLAMNLLVLSVALMLATMLVLTAVLWAFAAPLLRALSMETLVPWWWLVAMGLLAAGTYEMLTLWATRKRAYKIIAQTSVWQSAAGAIVKIALGLLTLKPAGLLIGQVVANGGGIGSLLRSFRADFSTSWRHLRLGRMKKLAVRHRGFPIYRVPSQVLMVGSTQAPLLFVAALFDAPTTGQLGLALMALALPVQLFGRTMARAFYAETANLGNRKPQEIRRIANHVLMRLAILSLPPSLILFFFAPNLFPLVFGAEWEMAGNFASLLAIYLFFQFIQTPVVHIFYLFDSQGALLYLNAQRIILISGCFFAAYLQTLSSSEAISIYAVILAMHYAFSIVYALKLIPTGKQ